MAIKLNGVETTSNRLNDSLILTEKLNGTVVYSITTILQWQFLGSSSSEPYNYDFYTEQWINGDNEEGLNWLRNNTENPDNLHEGFLAVIRDLVTLDYFDYVLVAVPAPVVPKQHQWVFMNPALDWSGTTYSQSGFQDPSYNSQGCASPSTLGTYLNSQVNPNGLSVGTKAAVRMNLPVGNGNCGTWAIFEVQEV